MFGGIGASEIILILIILPFSILIWVIPIIDAVKSEFTGSNKVIWVLVILFLPILGGILYVFIGRDQKINT